MKEAAPAGGVSDDRAKVVRPRMTVMAIGRGERSGRRKPAKAQLHALNGEGRRRDAPSADDPAQVCAFFDEQVPRLIAGRADLFNQLNGSLAVFVEGAGCWTIKFGDHASPEAIARGASFEADCVTVFAVQRFAALLDGRSDGPSPVMIGDGRLLGHLGQLMILPARGQLGARLSK